MNTHIASPQLKPAFTTAPQIMSTTELITPEKAESILATSKGNRPINKSRVDRYGEAMRDKQWVLNGESIIISADGSFLEGQHRLLACVKYKVPFLTIVTRGVSDPDAFKTIDVGIGRSTSDVLSIERVPNARTTAAVISKALQYKHSMGKSSVNEHNIPYKISQRRLMDLYFEYPDAYQRSVLAGKRCYDKLPMVIPSVAAACHFLFAEKDADKADTFIESIGNGENLKAGDPALTMREAWIRRAQEKRRDSAEIMMIKMVHAWNAYRNGRRISTVRHNSADAVPNII
jgi:hypothetical protein